MKKLWADFKLMLLCALNIGFWSLDGEYFWVRTPKEFVDRDDAWQLARNACEALNLPFVHIIEHEIDGTPLIDVRFYFWGEESHMNGTSTNSPADCAEEVIDMIFRQRDTMNYIHNDLKERVARGERIGKR